VAYPNAHAAAAADDDDDDKNSLLDKLLTSGVERSPEDQLHRSVRILKSVVVSV
jgi:hypothetical protein